MSRIDRVNILGIRSFDNRKMFFDARLARDIRSWDCHKKATWLRIHYPRPHASPATPENELDDVVIAGLRAFQKRDPNLDLLDFDHRHGESIRFFSPLTLIVGYNGSGKTTIVESLKYVLTGIQPPNTKVGGAFIHDPKLAGEKTIMAQVKLEFQSTKGVRVVATRSLQLEVKKTSRSMKTLDASLLLDNHGERMVISSRTAELDLLLPQYLGVSTAVIDNVIFCHQEESLWPMSDSSTLKKKFDEIFEAEKYTKAIKNLKDLRKAKNEDLGKYKIQYEHAKQDKERADKADKRARQLADEVAEMEAQHDELVARRQTAVEAHDKAMRESEEYSKILGALEGKQKEAHGKQATIDAIRENLKEVSESDEWLESTLEQFDSRLNQYQQQSDLKKERYRELEADLRDSRGVLSQKLADKGKYQQDKEENERHILRRKTMALEAATTHQIRGYEDLEDDAAVEDFVAKLQRQSKDLSSALERARRAADTEKRDAQSHVNKLTERRAALQNSKVDVKRRVAENDREAIDFQRQADSLNIDEGSTTLIQSRIDDVDQQLQSVRSIAQKATWDNKIQAANSELHTHEAESARLNMELIQGTKKAGETARLAHLKQETKDRERSLQTLTQAHGERISDLIGDAWTPSDIEGTHQRALETANQELRSAETRRNEVTTELDHLNFKQTSLRTELRQKEEQVKRDEQIVRDAIGDEPSEYATALQTAEYDLQEAMTQVKGHEGIISYIEQILETARSKKNPVCRTCSRAFKGPEDPVLGKMITRLSATVKKAETDTESANLEEVEKDHKRILDAGLAHERWEKLVSKEIPGVKAQIEKHTGERDAIVSRIEEHDRIVEKRQESLRELESISKTVSSIAKHDAEIKSFRSQVEELSAKQSQSSGGRTLEDIQEEISELANTIQTAKKTIERLSNEQSQSRAEVSRLEIDLRELKNDLIRASSKLEKKSYLVGRVNEFKTANQKQREALEKVDQDIHGLDPQIATAQAKLDDIVDRCDTKDRELSRSATALEKTVNGMNMVNDQIKSYYDRGGASLLSKIDREIQNVNQQISNLETERNQITVEVNQIEGQLKDSEATRRQYGDNLRYRKETRALEEIQMEMQQLESYNARIDRERYVQESTRLNREIQRLSAKIAEIVGETKSKDRILGELRNDYETDYKDAPKRYREQLINVEVTKAAVQDLGSMATALDQAVMKFHGIKMDQVNSIMEELWRKTYQGTDVDNILIRADNDSTGAKNRSYNYRVVMVKQDTEMDMRGRCSAGQKVLASIIIRLALAEVFSANCGLIALDEPTTNLDRDNIQALARALSDIIKVRRQQSNFQLIVITHDEQFLREMQCGDYADYYYRVSRDEKQNTQIERQSIAEVM